MASTMFKHIIFFFILGSFGTYWFVEAGDPDILTDFIISPQNQTIDGNFFTFTKLRGIFDVPFPETFNITKVSMAEFPALDGQSVGYAVLKYPAGVPNPPHIHPRSAELLFVVHGTLEVGFVDTANKLYTQTLQLGDIFVFPKGLVHYQYNADLKNSAIAISAFGSANAGTVSVPNAVFNTGIDDLTLAKSFKTDVATIQKIKDGLKPKP